MPEIWWMDDIKQRMVEDTNNNNNQEIVYVAFCCLRHLLLLSPKADQSFYHPTEGRRLSRPRWLVAYPVPAGLPACKEVTENAREDIQ